MTQYVPFVTDSALEDMKNDFSTGLLPLYKNLASPADVKSKIHELFQKPAVLESDIQFSYTPLILPDTEYSPTTALHNVRTIYETFRHFTPTEAATENIWVALENTYYLDYHLHEIHKLRGRKDVDDTIKVRTFMSGKHGEKRSQIINNLSHLWWVGHYTYDDSADDHYHLTKFFLATPYRGNAVVFSSSSVVRNGEVSLGILEAIKHLVESGQIVANRQAYSEACKIINIVGGVKLIDMMSREDVKEIIVKELPKSPLVTKS